jgi:hypothetical protein
VLPLLSDSLTDDNENFGKKSLVVVTNVIVEWIEQERRPAFLLVFKGAEGGSRNLGALGALRTLRSLAEAQNQINLFCSWIKPAAPRKN